MQCPFYPKPHKNKVSILTTFLMKRRSWLDGLYAKSYSMQTGRVKMPNFDLYIINDIKEVKKIMVDDVKDFPKSELLHRLLEPLLGVSIFTTNGEVWKKQRKLLNPSFEMTRIGKVFELMSEAASDMMARFSKVESQIIDLDEAMTFVTADVIFRTIMSEKLDEKQGKIILEAFTTFQEQTLKSAMRSMFAFPKWLSNLLGDKKRLKAGEVIRKALSDIIKPRYESVDSVFKADILDSLLRTIDMDTNERFSFKEILDQVCMLFLAGHETTASSLTWTLYCLALNPKWQDKAYDELKSVRKGEKFAPAELKELKILNNIFKEALRLYPPVGFFARSARKDFVLRDKEVKKGSGIVVAPWLIHRHKKLWDRPDEFDPERFNTPYNKDAYMPFGMGERICIGQGFAMQEAMILLGSILSKYKVVLKEGFVPDVVGRLTIRTANGLLACLEPRI